MLLFSSAGVSQSCSLIIDSITTERMEQCRKYQKRHFSDIVAARKWIPWPARMDSLQFDYAFIEETVCFENNEEVVTEKYFVKGDTIPRYVYYNGKCQKPGLSCNNRFKKYSKYVSDKCTLSPLLASYTRLKNLQELPYDKTQIWAHGCVVFHDSKREFKKERRAALKRTFQIQTFVDKVNRNILLSFQYAPANPVFRVIGYNAVWDW
jgi:hypothetical protein